MKQINTIGKREISAVTSVLESGTLSGFNASWGKRFLGGPKVQQLEHSICKQFSVKHAIAVNSWSSGLLIAVGSLQLEPGDEIIVSPWNMCSTVTSILQWLCVPVFCDIEQNTFSIDPDKLELCITDRSRAIILNDMHGRPTDFDKIKAIADKHNLKIISDSAQTIGAVYKGISSGTLADIGGFSFNWHKHVHCGEGGVLVTNDSDVAERLQLLRNHAEGVVENTQQSLANMIGFNFRLTEIQAAILCEQLHKLPCTIKRRQQSAKRFNAVFEKYFGYITIPKHTEDWSNVYCSYPLLFNDPDMRNSIYEQMLAKGFPVNKKFSRGCVHLLPVFQAKSAYGSTQIPWSLNKNIQDYSRGTCPVAEKLEQNYFVDICMETEYDDQDCEILENICINTIGSA